MCSAAPSSFRKHWERSYLRYFVALGAGFMLATALVEMVPESIHLRGGTPDFSSSPDTCLVHFFEHTVTAAFPLREETHAGQFVHSHKGYSVLIGLLIHTFFDGNWRSPSGFLFPQRSAGSSSWRFFLHKIPEGFTISSVMLASGRSRAVRLGSVRAFGYCDRGRSDDDGSLPPGGKLRATVSAGVYDLRRPHRI